MNYGTSITAVIIELFLLYLLCGRTNGLIAIVLAAFAIRISLVYYDVMIADLPGTGTDTLFFNYLAVEWQINSLSQFFSHFATGSRLYAWLLSLLYSLIGEDRFVAQSLNVFLACLTIINFFKSASYLAPVKWAKILTVIFAFWPTYLLFSSILLRESFLIYAISLGMVNYLAWLNNHSTINLLVSFLGFVLAAALHTGMLLTLVLFPVILLIKNQGRFLSAGSRFRRIVLMGTFSIVIFALLAAGVGLQKLKSTDDFSAGSLVDIQISTARDRTAYMSDVSASNYVDLLFQMPLRTVYFIVLPLPWQIQNKMDAVGAFDAMLYTILIGFLIVRLKRIVKNAGSRAILIVSLATILTFAFATSNYGTAIRHRTKFIALLLVLLPPPRSMVSQIAAKNKGKRVRDNIKNRHRKSMRHITITSANK